MGSADYVVLRDGSAEMFDLQVAPSGLVGAGPYRGVTRLVRGLTLPLVARWLDVGETPRRADDVMVLTGDENTRLENQDPSVRTYDYEAIL